MTPSMKAISVVIDKLDTAFKATKNANLHMQANILRMQYCRQAELEGFSPRSAMLERNTGNAIDRLENRTDRQLAITVKAGKPITAYAIVVPTQPELLLASTRWWWTKNKAGGYCLSFRYYSDAFYYARQGNP